MFFKNGDQYLGQFKNNEFEGQGKFIHRSGESEEGIFQKGRLIKNNKNAQERLNLNKIKIKDIILEKTFRNKNSFITNNDKIKLRSMKTDGIGRKNNSFKSDERVLKDCTNNKHHFVNLKYNGIARDSNAKDSSSWNNFENKITRSKNKSATKPKFNICKTFTLRPSLTYTNQFNYFTFKKHYSDGDSINSETLTIDNFSPFFDNNSDDISIYSKQNTDSNTSSEIIHKYISKNKSCKIGPNLNFIKSKILAKASF